MLLQEFTTYTLQNKSTEKVLVDVGVIDGLYKGRELYLKQTENIRQRCKHYHKSLRAGRGIVSLS